MNTEYNFNMSLENKKPQVIIIGMRDIGVSVARMAIESLSSTDVILIDSDKDLTGKTRIVIDGENASMADILPKEIKKMRERIFELKAYEPLRDVTYLNEPCNPYPSPKGRKGKKRY